MPILQQKPVTPSGRFFLKNKVDLDTKRPERSLTKGVHRKKGRNAYGRITSRRRVADTKGFTVKLTLEGND